MLVWMRLRRAARTAAMLSGSSTSSAITTPTNEFGNPTAATPASIDGETSFASPTTATSESSSSPRLTRARARGRRRRVVVVAQRLAVGGDRQEEVAVLAASGW